ncbi:MAG: hypothetical protein Q9N62_14795 [Ghiorsea sp.]|nr:hypothetical protein [Ghiorsea sp.]
MFGYLFFRKKLYYDKEATLSILAKVLILADSWFSSSENMDFVHKKIKKHFIIALKSNRLVALSLKDKKQGKFVRIDKLGMVRRACTRVGKRSGTFQSFATAKFLQTKMSSIAHVLFDH